MDYEVSQQSMQDKKQLEKYAEDIVKVYKSEKEKRKQLEKEVLEKQKAHEQLEHVNEFLNAIMESTTNAILTFEPDGKVTFFNSKVLELTGFSDSEIINLHYADLFEKGKANKMEEYFKQTIENGESVSQIEQTIERKDKKKLLISFSLSPLKEKGKITGVVGVAEDITEKRSTELQLIHSSKMATLGEMATGIAHELNQPLSVIRMSAQMVHEGIDEGDLEEDFLKGLIEKVLAQVTRATGVINHLRSFGRKTDANHCPMQANEPIKNAFNMLTERLKLHSVEVNLQMAENLPEIMGETLSLEQVFINLIVNATDAMDSQTDAHKKKINVKTEYNNSGNNIIIEFSDNGPGIPEEIIDKVFDAFFTTKEVGEGTGLGLSISHSIIAAHKGTITIVNTGKGTTFTIKLPAKK